MDRLKTPLTAVVVIFICSLVGAIVVFKFLESTAAFEDSRGLKLGGAIVGFLVTFGALWQAFHNFSRELGNTNQEKMAEQIKNLQNQLVRQNPPPDHYRRLLSEDFKLVAHVPEEWAATDNTMILYAPKNAEAFMDNIVIYRTLARRLYRKLQTQITKQQLDTEVAQDQTKTAALQAQWEQVQRDFLTHQDDPPSPNEKVEDVLQLEVAANANTILGVPEQTEVAGHPAVRFQVPSPAADALGRQIFCIFTEIYVKQGEGYVYQVVLTSTAQTIASRTPVYNKIISSLNFFT